MEKEKCNLTVFETTGETSKPHEDRHNLPTDRGGSEIGINILVTLQIAAPIEKHIKSVVNMPRLRDLKLAHPASTGSLFDIAFGRPLLGNCWGQSHKRKWTNRHGI